MDFFLPKLLGLQLLTGVHLLRVLLPGLRNPVKDEVGLDDAGGLGHLLQEGQPEVVPLVLVHAVAVEELLHGHRLRRAEDRLVHINPLENFRI